MSWFLFFIWIIAFKNSCVVPLFSIHSIGKNGFFLATSKNRLFLPFFYHPSPPSWVSCDTIMCVYIPPANVTAVPTNRSVRSSLPLSTHSAAKHGISLSLTWRGVTDTFVRDMVRVMMADGRAHENSLQMSRRLFVRKEKEEKRERTVTL